MKNYDLMAVFKPNLDNDELDEVLDKMAKGLKELGGKVISTEKTGRKKLAYDIQNFRDGFFVTMILEIPEDKVADFNRNLRLNENILRIMFLEQTKSMQGA